MRDYAKVSPSFWTGETGKKLRKNPESQIVAMYLMTCPQSNMIGLFYMPIVYIAHETGLGLEGASKGLEWAKKSGFCSYDDESEVVWVYEMAFYQIGSQLKPTDLRCKGVQTEYDKQPNNPYMVEFYKKYAEDFCMNKCRSLIVSASSEYEAPYKPLVSQEQEQEQEHEQEQKEHVNEDVHATVSKPEKFKDEINNVFEHWKKVMNKRDTVILDSKRKSAIRARLVDGYTQDQLCKAVDGCSTCDHNMGRTTNSKTTYNDIELICRNGPNVDRFIEMAGQASEGPNQDDEVVAQVNIADLPRPKRAVEPSKVATREETIAAIQAARDAMK